AHDIGAGARIVRPERVGLLVGEIVHDRGRFPEHEIAVDEGGRTSGRVEGEIFGRALLPLDEIDEHKLERDADMGGDGAHLPVVGRWEKSVELHGRLLLIWVDEETSQANSATSLSSPSVQPA